MDDIQLTDMELYCIARLIQSSFQAPKQESIITHRSLYGCMYCKYAFECRTPENGRIHFQFEKIFDKLQTLTGVSLGMYNPEQHTPETIGSVFFPGSYYIEHPEMLHELEKIHPESMMDGFKTCLEKVINLSKENPDQK